MAWIICGGSWCGCATSSSQSQPFKRLLNSKFTKLRAQHYSIQMAYYVQNRRDCWGYVQGSAPLPCQTNVWRHEEDELVGQKAQGKVDHITLAIKEGEVFGLSAEAFEKPRAWMAAKSVSAPGFAWRRNLGSKRSRLRRSWKCAIPAELIEGGSLSRRIAAIFERDLGIPMKKQINNAEHVVMDVEHAHLLMQVAKQYATTPSAQEAILCGARESLMIDRVYRGHLADMLDSLA